MEAGWPKPTDSVHDSPAPLADATIHKPLHSLTLLAFEQFDAAQIDLLALIGAAM
jgi:hypothetical protein